MNSLKALFLTLFLSGSIITSIAQSDQQLTKEIFKELAEINTTHSTGNTTEAAEAMAARLKAAGFEDKDLFIGGAHPKKGNLVARLRGTGKKKPVLLMAHIDVVEANPEDWTFDPFTFLEQDGYFYARGIADDKAMASIFVANLIRLKKEKYNGERDIIVALTADEEGGPHNGIDWLLKNHPELMDAEFAINEGGGGQLKDGKKVLNGVQLSEKVYQSFQLEATDPGGHSSRPRKDNPIYHIAKALDNLAHYDFPVNLNDGTRVFFERSAKLEEGQLSADMKGVTQNPPVASAVKNLSADPYYNALLRTTCVATMLGGGHAENALPQTATAVVNCRILPNDDPEKIKEQLVKVFDNDKIKVTAMNPAAPSPPSPLDPVVFGGIERVTAKMWPGVPVVPVMSTGATDGAHTRRAGIPTFGVSGIFSEPGESNAHGMNEKIQVKSYYEGQEFLYQLTKELTQPVKVDRKR
ncbi:MAG: M20/M25/M40 family metallo-hydrolase [Cyclobacteriaceae bacterium]